MRLHVLLVMAITAVAVAGCSYLPFNRERPRQAPIPPPLAAAPSGSVTAAPLPPPGGAAIGTTPGIAGAPGMQVATAAPTATNMEVGRTDLLGGWTITAAGDSCQLFMTLTTWSGGYRASTKGCGNAALQNISAWNMEGNQVQLLNDSGTTVARLYPASKTLFNGQTEGGGPVSVSR
jgi:hypothetical protein